MTPRQFSWIVFVIGIGGCQAESPPTPFKPVADMKQLMASVLEPAADGYWDAVGSIIDETGTHEFAPKSDEDWTAVQNSAYVIAESGNLMMMGTRARDGGEWIRLSRALVEVGERALRAAQARDPVAVFDVGADVYEACTRCHAIYAVGLSRPNAKPQ